MSGIDAAAVGTVLSDSIELRVGQSGKKWAGFNLGVGENDTKQFIRISVFGSLAERLATELKKGDRVYVEGHTLRLSEWTGRDGEKRVGLQMVAGKVERPAIGKNKPPKQKPGAQATNGDAQRDWQRPFDPDRDDRIPF